MVLGWYIFFSHGIIENVLNVFIRAKRVSNGYMQQKKTDRLCVCGCSANLLVLVLGRQIVYGQNTVYICLSKYIVFENTQQYKHHVVRSIARSGVSPPGARSDGHHWCQAARTVAPHESKFLQRALVRPSVKVLCQKTGWNSLSGAETVEV